MKDKKSTKTADRRDFLKLMGVGAVTGGSVLGAGMTSAEAADEHARQGGHYRETQHIKTYYDLAKF